MRVLKKESGKVKSRYGLALKMIDFVILFLGTSSAVRVLRIYRTQIMADLRGGFVDHSPSYGLEDGERKAIPGATFGLEKLLHQTLHISLPESLTLELWPSGTSVDQHCEGLSTLRVVSGL